MGLVEYERAARVENGQRVIPDAALRLAQFRQGQMNRAQVKIQQYRRQPQPVQIIDQGWIDPAA